MHNPIVLNVSRLVNVRNQGSGACADPDGGGRGLLVEVPYGPAINVDD